MTPAEKTLIKALDDRLFEVQEQETGNILRVSAVRDDWRTLDAGTLIGVDYTRIGDEKVMFIKRRGEMTTLDGIMAVNKELKTGIRVLSAEQIVVEGLGALYLWDEKATKEDIAERKRVIAADRAAAKALKEMAKS